MCACEASPLGQTRRIKPRGADGTSAPAPEQPGPGLAGNRNQQPDVQNGTRGAAVSWQLETGAPRQA